MCIFSWVSSVTFWNESKVEIIAVWPESVEALWYWEDSRAYQCGHQESRSPSLGSSIQADCGAKPNSGLRTSWLTKARHTFSVEAGSTRLNALARHFSGISLYSKLSGRIFKERQIQPTSSTVVIAHPGSLQEPWSGQKGHSRYRST